MKRTTLDAGIDRREFLGLSIVGLATLWIDTGCTPGCTVTTCSCTRPSEHWSSTSNDFLPYQGWIVDFTYGSVYFEGKFGWHHVRAVRGG